MQEVLFQYQYVPRHRPSPPNLLVPQTTKMLLHKIEHAKFINAKVFRYTVSYMYYTQLRIKLPSRKIICLIIICLNCNVGPPLLDATLSLWYIPKTLWVNLLLLEVTLCSSYR